MSPSHPATLSPCHLVIAYGNPLRQDDAAGLLLARKVVEIWQAQGIAVQHVEVQQLVPELVAQIAATEVARVFFFDAAVGDALATLQVRPVEVGESTVALGHHLTPATLMVYARLLYGHSPPAWLVTVPGVNFGHGEGVSSPVQKILTLAPLVAEGCVEK